MKYIVERKTWYRGEKFDSALLNAQGSRCCIGFVGRQCGISDDKMLQKGYAHDVKGTFWPEWFGDQMSVALSNAYLINDNPNINDTTREAQLKELFASNGDEIEFV